MLFNCRIMRKDTYVIKQFLQITDTKLSKNTTIATDKPDRIGG